ncbi:hypothetical protein [Phormidium tenue]|uniref:hypothetical protein n=1 Tax=Phormidium tenue TaxID=126344 RepID=UPI0015C53C0A|nr:hypothetical protein [Phormidium tenue]MBD2234941.1 hypothetical protein [Phormidium tenue FACHB-1052]
MGPGDWPANWQVEAPQQQAANDTWRVLAWVVVLGLLIYIGIRQQRQGVKLF